MTEAQIVCAETAIMLLHPDERRRATAKECIYAILYPRDDDRTLSTGGKK